MDTQNEAWHWKLDKAKKSDDNSRKWDKEKDVQGRKMVSEDVKVIDVSLDTDVCLSLYAEIILLGFKRHKITGWEIIVHKHTLNTCGHDQNTWLKKMKAFNSQLRPLETARRVQTQHGIDTEEE